MGAVRVRRRFAAVAVLVTAVLAGLVSPAAAEENLPAPPHFVVATFNVLGHTHTEPGGRFASMADGVTRMGWTLTLLQRRDIAVAGLQEFQRPQREWFTSAQTEYRVWPGNNHPNRYKQNVVTWRRSQFAFVDGFTFTIPYLNDFWAPQAVVRLRERVSGQEFYVLSVHNVSGQTQDAFAERATALDIEIEVTKRLLAEGLPVITTGDFNERESTFCRYTGSVPMIAAAGGSNVRGVCEPPPASIARVDWVFGSRQHMRFSDYAFVRSPLVQRISDHPLIVARTTFR
jgi:endonuclease/exonuclease/phosphatase family metal-dependent hydrolase